MAAKDPNYVYVDIPGIGNIGFPNTMSPEAINQEVLKMHEDAFGPMLQEKMEQQKPFGKEVTAALPGLGAALGGTVGGFAGLPAGMGAASPVTVPLMAAGGAALGAGMGTQLEYLTNQAMGYAPAPGTLEMLSRTGQNMGTAATIEMAMPIIGRYAGNVLLPGAKAMTEEVKMALQMAKNKKLPIPADITKTWAGKTVENLPELGMGGFLLDWRRKQAATGLTQAVKQIGEDFGIVPQKPIDVAQDIAGILKGSVSGSGEYEVFKAAIDRLPKSAEYPMDNLRGAMLAVGKRKAKLGGELGEQAGIDDALRAIESVYSRNAPEFVEAVRDVVANNFKASPQQIKTIESLIQRGISKTGWTGGTAQGKGLSERLRGGIPESPGFYDDLAFVQTDTGNTLGQLQSAKKEAYKEAHRVINEVNPTLNLLYAPREATGIKQRGANYQITHLERNLESAVDKLFSPVNSEKALTLQKQLEALGRSDVWDTAKMSYIESVFNSCTKAKGSETYFDPTAYKAWFANNGTNIKKLMPEHYDQLKAWNSISDAYEADMKRFMQSKERTAIRAVGGLTGGSVAMAGSTAGIVVPQAFSMISALSVMKVLGRPNSLMSYYLTKSEAPLFREAAKFGAQQYLTRE